MKIEEALNTLNGIVENGFAHIESGKPNIKERNAIKLAISALDNQNIKEMKVFTCTDHATHYPVGGASVVVAPTEQTARNSLKKELQLIGLNSEGDFTLVELDLTKRQAIVLADGEY
jgi:hypothetical protein